MRFAIAVPIVAALLLPAGCRWLAAPHFDTPKPQPADLPLTERQVQPPDASAVTEPQPEPPPAGYYKLTADECHALACKNSSAANLIESSVIVQPGCFANLSGRAYADWVRVTAARHLSGEARSRTASAALTLYYRLLELELKSDVLKHSLDELDALVKANDILLARGFKETADAYQLKKQRIDLLGERAKLRSAIQKLNAELKSLLAIDPGTSGFLLPADQVKVVPDPIDADQAVQAGLRRRNDLNLLRNLAGMADHRTTPSIRKVMTGLTPVLGAVVNQSADDVPLAPFVPAMAKAEAASVRRQLLGLLKDREREAAKEIRTAIEEWGTARDLVAIARKKFELGQERVTDYEKRQKVGQGVELELRKARLELLQSEADLIGEIAKWKLADVKAREAIGLLCGECN
jgi:Outer membrane efflux protein